MLRVLCLHFLYLVATSHLWAQQPTFYTYNRSNGLPSNYINAIFQDKQGYMWFATDKGVCRYDGRHFKTYNTDNGLAGNMVYHIFEDSKSRIWFGLYEKGVSYFYKDSIYSLETSLQKPLGSIKGIAEDAYGNIYLEGETRCLVWQNGQHQFLDLGTKGWIKKLSSENFLWKNGSLYFLVFPHKNQLYHRPVYWENTVFKQNIDTLINSYMYISEIDKKSFWWHNSYICTIQKDTIRLSQAKEKKVRKHSYKHLLPYLLSTYENKSYEDYEGNIWVSSFGKGVQKFTKSYLSNYLINDEIDGIFRQNDTTFLLAGKEGLYQMSMNGATKDIKKIADDRFLQNVRAVTKYQNQYFIGTFKHILQTKNLQVYWSDTTRCSAGVADFYSYKDELFVATYGEGVLHYQNQKLDTISVKQGMVSNMIERLVEGRNGYIWALSLSSGANEIHLQSKKTTKLDKTDGLLSNSVFYVWAENENKTWIGTQSGFSRVEQPKGKPRKITNYTSKNGLIGERVVCIFRSKQGQIIVLSDLFLHLFDEKKGILTALKGFDLSPFDNDLTINKAYFQPDTQQLYLATNKGLKIIAIGAIRQPQIKPRIVLQSANNQVPSDYPPKFSHTLRNINFQVAMLSFTNETENELFFCLDDSETWESNKSNDLIQLQNMAYGEHTLRVYMRNPDGVQSEILFISFEIATPFWWQKWFIALLGLLLVALIALIARYYTQRKFKQKLENLELQNKIQQERERIARDLHDNVGSQLTYIVASLEHTSDELSEKPKQKEKLLYLRSFARNTITQLRETIWAMNQEQISTIDFETKLRDWLWQYQQQLPIKCQIESTITQHHTLEPSQALHLFRIVQESINNALKHSEASQINIVIDDRNVDKLEIKVIDNGKGFDKSLLMSNEHYGLKNIQKRAKEMNASLDIRTTLGKGTTVWVKL